MAAKVLKIIDICKFCVLKSMFFLDSSVSYKKMETSILASVFLVVSTEY